MKKLSIIIVLTSLIYSACTKNLSDLNIDVKNPPTAVPEGEFAAALKNYTDLMTTPSVNTNIFELITQYWAETQYPGESQYQLTPRDIPRNWWATLYGDVLVNVKDAKKGLELQTALSPEDISIKNNKIAICNILFVQAYSTLVNTFGDVPYTDALNIDQTTTPKYDNQKDIYYSLIDTLNNALSMLDPSVAGMGTYDILYADDVSKWVKYGNSIKLSLGLLIYDVDAAKASQMVMEAAPNVFTSNDDNAVFYYLTATPNTNPIWVNLVQSQRDDFVPANTLVSKMNDLNDPRRNFYFTNEINGKYVGGITGTGNAYANFSHVADAIKATDYPSLLMDYAQVEFLLAEAKERGINIPNVASAYYANAITASIMQWGGSETDATSYLAQPNVNYTTAAGTWQEKIGIQSWIHLYLRGYESWTQQRKLDYPKLIAPPLAISPYPVRYIYPSNENTLNEDNVASAAQNIGGDEVDTKLFWDKH